MFDPFAAGQDVERDVQDMVGFVIRQMPLEDVDIAVDIADQPGPASQQVHGTDATGTEALDTIGQLVMDVGRGHHRLVALGPGRFSMRLRILRLRSLRILRLRSRDFLRSRSRVFRPLRFRDLSGIVALTRKPPLFGIVKMCSHLHYSKISWAFRVFSEILTSMVYISRLVKV